MAKSPEPDPKAPSVIIAINSQIKQDSVIKAQDINVITAHPAAHYETAVHQRKIVKLIDGF
jgi:hypothetical protein